jgi:heme A synthase
MGRAKRASVLGEIRNPLVFFALALLVIEAIMGTVVARSNMTPALVFASFCIMAGLFVLVVAMVALITIKWPQNLYEQVRRDLQSAHRTEEFLRTQAFRDAVQDIASDAVAKELLARQDK